MKKQVKVTWYDSYGPTQGWCAIEDFSPHNLLVESLGFVIHENNDVLAIALNYSEETVNTSEQANGIMVIPKCCIKSIDIVSTPMLHYLPRRCS